MAHQIPAEDTNPSVMDLARHLGTDAKRLIADEAELAKLELKGSVHRAGRGALWLGAAFGTTVITLVAFTIFLVAAIGRAANGHYWVGAFATAALELAAGYLLIKRGLGDFKSAPYSMPETRQGLHLLVTTNATDATTAT
jgi:hypothetical protein